MARYELGTDFWDITQDGKELHIIAGRIGSHGTLSVRKFISPDHAAKQLAKLVAEKLAAGFREVDRATDEPDAPAGSGAVLRHGELEVAIENDPKDEQAYSVYADWLQAEGHPRGELIALQLAEEANPDDKRLRAASTKFLAANAGPLIGNLAEYMRLRGAGDGALIWRFGFIHRLELYREHDDSYEIGELLDRVLRHPSGRFVAEIAIRDDADSIKVAVARLTKLAPKTLRSLALISIGDLGDLSSLSTIPRLQRLAVKSRADLMGGNDGGALSKRCVQSIVKGPWPLETLELRFGGNATFRELEPLFRRTDLPTLTELRLRSPRFGDELCRALVDSPLAGQLVTLEIGMAELDDATLQLLVDSKPKLGRLRELGVSRSLVSPKLLATLRGAFDRVVDASRDPDDYDDEGYFEEIVE